MSGLMECFLALLRAARYFRLMFLLIAGCARFFLSVLAGRGVSSFFLYTYRIHCGATGSNQSCQCSGHLVANGHAPQLFHSAANFFAERTEQGAVPLLRASWMRAIFVDPEYCYILNYRIHPIR